MLSEKYLEILSKMQLFNDIEKDEINALLKCMKAKIKTYKKNEYILLEGHNLVDFGVVLNGKVNILKDDYWGNRAILGNLQEGSVFGEVYAMLENKKTEVSVISVVDTKILFLNAEKIVTICSESCFFHSKIIKNIITEFAHKNLFLTKKIEFLTKKTTRDKLLSYLYSESKKTSEKYFYIPFDRQQLADYLSVDRSALSFELSKLKKEGILEYSKNCFRFIYKRQINIDYSEKK